jgi:hypothetical protein
MNMDQTVLNWIFAAAGASAGWILKIVWDAICELKKDLRQIERDLPVVYTRKDDFKDEVRELKEDMKIGFGKIEATLNALFKRLDRTP